MSSFLKLRNKKEFLVHCGCYQNTHEEESLNKQEGGSDAGQPKSSKPSTVLAARAVQLCDGQDPIRWSGKSALPTREGNYNRKQSDFFLKN